MSPLLLGPKAYLAIAVAVSIELAATVRLNSAGASTLKIKPPPLLKVVSARTPGAETLAVPAADPVTVRLNVSEVIVGE
jgi:hypothetical protein